MSRPVRTAARAMLATIFVVSGARGALHPEPMAPAAKRLADRLSPLLSRAGGDRRQLTERDLVQIDHATKLIGGLGLLTPLRRPAAALLAASLVPTTLTVHGFWRLEDPAMRAEQQIHFMKNVGLFGGLLLAASDTEGRPGLRWRAGHAARVARRARRTAGGAKRLAGGAKHGAQWGAGGMKRGVGGAARTAGRLGGHRD